MSEFLDGLNRDQREAVQHGRGPIVVFAGAGSGKTRVIVHRIARLIKEENVAPWKILAVTFTNKAAGEMRERVNHLIHHPLKVHIATFHSACVRWLREFADHLGFDRQFSIYDDGDTSSAIKTLAKSLVPKDQVGPLVATMRSFIHKAKTQAFFPGDIEKIEAYFGKGLPPGAISFYRSYQEYLAQCQAMDFDDLLMNTLLLLRNNTQVREALQNRYQFVLVDEFQDTNPAQFELVETLAKVHSNIFVVGDDDQSIYSWRGAVPQAIINFEHYFPGARRVLLRQNYRSVSNIVKAANQLIQNNIHRVEKELFSEVGQGSPIDYCIESDGQAESWAIVDRIRSELHTWDYSKFAIIYRTNAQSRNIEEALVREGMPYQIYGSLRFYERVEIKDLVAYLKIFANEADDISLKRIINLPARGIGKKAVDQIEIDSIKKKQSMMVTIRDLAQQGLPRFSGKLANFLNVLDSLKSKLSGSHLGDVIPILVEEIDYQNYIIKKYPDLASEKIENIHELASALEQYASSYPDASLASWLEHITLQSEEKAEEGMVGIHLLTLHAAKGLEFERVFIAGLEDGLIPHRGSKDDPLLLEEERRLLYVGMTRARSRLSLYGVRQRQTYNQVFFPEVSDFIRELPLEEFAIDQITAEYLGRSGAYSRSKDSDQDLELVYDEMDFSDQVSVGMRVVHPTYGKGVVDSLDRSGCIQKAIVDFFEVGKRKVSLTQLSC